MPAFDTPRPSGRRGVFGAGSLWGAAVKAATASRLVPVKSVAEIRRFVGAIRNERSLPAVDE
jgi:hypothetical protein